MNGSHGEGGRGGAGGGGKEHSAEGHHRGGQEVGVSQRGVFAEAAAAAYSPNRRAQQIETLAQKAFTSQEPGPENRSVPRKNADCGPTALATAMKALHDVPFSANVGREITRDREEMTGANNHQQPTSTREVAAAAKLNGLKTETVRGLKEVNEALSRHMVVIQLGEPGHMMNGVNFAGTHPTKPNTMEHFVTVLGLNPLTGKYIVDSSERTGPIQVSAAQMRAFITRPSGVFEGIALSNTRTHLIGRDMVARATLAASLTRGNRLLLPQD